MDTKTELIGGGTIALIALGIGAYLIYKKEIGNTIEKVGSGYSDIIGGVGDLSKGTTQAANMITSETGETAKSVLDTVQSVFNTFTSWIDKLKPNNQNDSSNNNALPNNRNDKKEMDAAANKYIGVPSQPLSNLLNTMGTISKSGAFVLNPITTNNKISTYKATAQNNAVKTSSSNNLLSTFKSKSTF